MCKGLISISHLLVRDSASSSSRANYFAMNFSNHSNTTSENLLSIIPNPNLNLVQVVFFTLISFLLVIAALSSNTYLIVSLAKKSSVPLGDHLMINLCLVDFVKSCLYFIVYTTSTPVNSWFWVPSCVKFYLTCWKAVKHFPFGF